MASTLCFLLLFAFIVLINTSIAHKPVVLPVTKDLSTLQYTTHFYWGTPMGPTKLVLDLGGPFPWVDCTLGHLSSSHQPTTSPSLQCSRANGSGIGRSCSLNIVNTITRVAARGELAEDMVAVDHFDRSDQINPIPTVDQFLFLCAPSLLLNGLASGAKGMLGLGRTRISLPSQLATKFGLHQKFSVCLSPSDGVVLSSDRPNVLLRGPDVANSLMYTPLVSNQDGTLEDYYINVKSIRINGKRLALDTSILSMDQIGNGGTKLSTIVPYTTMESTIYETFTKAYIKAATSMNMTRVAPVAPFGVCFSSDGIRKTRVGPAVPAIDLVLQSEMVKWRMHGRNSMVELSDGVMCLGFLDGGLSPRASIVLGGYQLEDHLLEFDMGTCMLGFSSSLLMRGISCSDFRLYYMTSE